MKKAIVLFAGSLATLLAAGPGFAQSTSPSMNSGKENATTSSAPAEKPSRFSMPHRVSGEVVATDASANTLTVKDSKGKEYTLKADSDAAPRLGDLKVGDHVKVNYRKSQGEMVATKIIEAQTPARATR